MNRQREITHFLFQKILKSYELSETLKHMLSNIEYLQHVQSVGFNLHVTWVAEAILLWPGSLNRGKPLLTF